MNLGHALKSASLRFCLPAAWRGGQSLRRATSVAAKVQRGSAKANRESNTGDDCQGSGGTDFAGQVVAPGGDIISGPGARFKPKIGPIGTLGGRDKSAYTGPDIK